MTAIVRKEYKGAAPQTTVATQFNSSAVSLVFTDLTGYPTGSVGPFYVVVGEGLSNEEQIYCASRTGNTITVASPSDRGANGTTAGAHAIGETVNHVFTAADADDANKHAADTTRDDHTQYHTTARHAAVSHLIGTHLPTPGNPATVGTSASPGSSTTAAREDHVHALSNAVADATNGIGLFGGVLYARVDGTSVRINGAGAMEVDPSVGTVTDGSITTPKLAASAVTTAKITDANVTTAKIATGAITSALIADGTIATADIASGAVTLGLLATDSVDQTKIVQKPRVEATFSGVCATTSGTFFFVSFDAVNYNIGTLWSAGAPTRLTIPTGFGGLWLLEGYAQFGANATGSRAIKFRKNASIDLPGALSAHPARADGGASDVQLCCPVVLAAADYVEMGIYQNAVTPGNTVSATPVFKAVFLGK